MYGLHSESGDADLYPTYVLLPLALAASLTAALFSVQWLVELSTRRDQGPEKHQTIFTRSKVMKPRTRSPWKNTFLPMLAIAVIGVPALSVPVIAAASEAARVVKYGKEDIVPIRAKLRFSTLIVLPDDEEILDFTTGDKEFWIINGSHNLCYVHPAQAGIRSNLNLITASGHVYSFVLAEISNDPNAEPDLKIFVEPKDNSGIGGKTLLRGYVSAGEAEAYKKELEALRAQTAEQLQAAQVQSVEQVNRFRSEYATKLQFDYRLDAKAAREPFLVSTIYHDDGFTYIKCAAREKPVLYEIKDGKPNLTNFQLENGVYVVPKIVDYGYLAVGKKRLPFRRQSSAK
jgi:type IV secretory pathway VirB9-like protein